MKKVMVMGISRKTYLKRSLDYGDESKENFGSGRFVGAINCRSILLEQMASTKRDLEKLIKAGYDHIILILGEEDE